MPDPAPGPIHQHPLAYVAGLEGVALLRAYAGEHDDAFVTERFERLRAMLEHPDAWGTATTLEPLSVAGGYDGWAADYDDPNNGLFALEEAVVHPWLDDVAPGVALDAACGTGRHAGYLVARGHRVIGVDVSGEMLRLARVNAPAAAYTRGDVRRLPLSTGSADLVVFSLAASHLPVLDPAFAEFARVLRPGGELILTDTRSQFLGSRRYPLPQRAPDGHWGYLPGWQHRDIDHLRAGLAHGLHVIDCAEVLRESTPVAEFWEFEAAAPGEPPDIWNLMAADPAATVAAYHEAGALACWRFRRSAEPAP